MAPGRKAPGLDGLDIRADHNIPCSDGIDIDSSRRVRARNVDIDVDRVLPIMRNVTIRNITGTVKSVGIMHGSTGSPILNVKFATCNITADKGLVMENARQVDLSGLKIAVKNGDAITKKNVE